MSSNDSRTLMTFEGVISDYLFFQEHITEITEMRRHFGAHLSRMSFARTPIQYLDFGCGDGGIPHALERDEATLRGKTQFTLVEPSDTQRAKAVARLQDSSQWPVVAHRFLPEIGPERFDFILASHSLYYVTEVETTVKALYDRMNPSALFVIAMECSDSPTKKIWQDFFDGIGRPIPFHLSEAVRDALDRQKIPYEIDPLHAEMEFPDSTENRRHVARFLLGPYYSLQEEAKTLSYFDSLSRNGTVHAPMSNDLYVVER